MGESCAGGASRLTGREREVLRRMSGGESTRQIAEGLAIAPSTVRTHAQNVLMKLEVRSRVEAAAATAAGAADACDARVLDTLTPRESQVLRCVADGLSRAAVAERLFVSPHTVRTHLRNVLAKLQVHSTLAAVALVRRLPDPSSNFAGP